MRINPFDIAENNNIHVRFVDFQDLPLGLTTAINGQKFILLSDTIKECRIRYFVCAHELFHSMEHDRLFSYYTRHENSKSKLEREANQFALDTIVKLYLERFDNEDATIYDVLDYFCVPRKVYDNLQ